MSKITISVDSTADLGKDNFEKYGFEVVSIGIVLDGDVRRDYFDITPEDIYKAVEVDKLAPKTNAALELDYKELFEKATKDGGSIFHFSVSSKLSLSHANALAAAKGMDRVYVIDSLSNSVGTGLHAIKVKEILEDENVKKLITGGKKTLADVAEEAKAMATKIDAGFIISDLKYLHRGGRVTGIKLLGANLLKIRPSLHMIADGTLVPARKFKGDYTLACKEYIKHRLEQAPNVNKDIAVVVHSAIEESLVTTAIADLKAAGFKEVLRCVAGAGITTHAGRNLLGLAIFND